MRIVRTIGQAFEVCHKVAQQQMQERSLEDNESNNAQRTKGFRVAEHVDTRLYSSGSIISEEDVDAMDAEEKLAVVTEISRSPSPIAVDPPPPAPGFTSGRLSGVSR
jgi:hypothetical protein